MNRYDAEASRRVQELLESLEPTEIQRRVRQPHDAAREHFTAPSQTVTDATAFHALVTDYAKHHLESTGNRSISREHAFSVAHQALLNRFPPSTYLDGYHAALATAKDRSRGGAPAVLNLLASALKDEAIRRHIEAIYHELVNRLSHRDAEAVAATLEQRFGELLKSWGRPFEPFVVAQRPLQAYQAVRREVEGILLRRDTL